MKTPDDLTMSVAKPRYEILDGLRGVAAFYILIYHLFEGAGVMLGHGYLGVDFFYALSGFVILVALPLIVCMGAGSEIRGEKSMAACRFLGEISYPLYITHLPFVYIQMAWISNHPNAPLAKVVTLSSLLFIVSLAVAYAAWRLYDLPVRAWLSKRFLKRAA